MQRGSTCQLQFMMNTAAMLANFPITLKFFSVCTVWCSEEDATVQSNCLNLSKF